MNRVIPLIDSRVAEPTARSAGDLAAVPAVGHVVDRLGRPLRDLRISVTDRCNFRCVVLHAEGSVRQGLRFLARKELLTFEEIARLARIFRGLGIEKIRLTGGEPLLRKASEQADRDAVAAETTPAMTRPHADDQRLGARAQGAALADARA